jgi:hypothetical protein
MPAKTSGFSVSKMYQRSRSIMALSEGIAAGNAEGYGLRVRIQEIPAGFDVERL